MRLRGALVLAVVVASAALPTPARAQRVIDLTAEMLERWLDAKDKEKSELRNVEPQLTDVDSRIKKFEDCKRNVEAVGGTSGKSGLAARLVIKAKCGSSDSDGMRKDRQKIMDGPENAAAAAGKFKLAEYRNLSEKLQSYMGGDETGFTKAGLDLLKSKRAQVASALGVSMDVAQSGGGGSGGRGMRAPAIWNTDYAWLWISQMFAVQYLSGATMFEKDYKPGEWTRWQVKTADNEDVQIVERAFIARQSDRGEWWRMKTIVQSQEGQADTIVMESLFRPDSTNEYVQTLVRMRGKFPGNAEAQEMMVPEQWSTWNMMGAFPYKPTKESVEGATIGMEDVKTPAGTFKAKHVRFGQGGGTLDWWIDETTIGGWVKFSALDAEKKPQYTMELIAKGTGAKSELGITVK